MSSPSRAHSVAVFATLVTTKTSKNALMVEMSGFEPESETSHHRFIEFLLLFSQYSVPYLPMTKFHYWVVQFHRLKFIVYYLEYWMARYISNHIEKSRFI